MDNHEAKSGNLTQESKIQTKIIGNGFSFLEQKHLGRKDPIHNLPGRLTKLVGRKEDIHKVRNLLLENHLLTIVGPGGVGKTRLALEVAYESLNDFQHSVFFISLVAVNTPKLLVSTIAELLGLSFHNQEDSSQLLNYLRKKEMLLVLDNYEHLLPATDLLFDIQQQAPQVKLLVTSRHRLNLHSEWVFEAQGLATPSHETTPNIEQYGAVQLFCQHAQRVRTNFVITAENQPHLIRICQMVAGLPLAIELAAAWVRVLPCREIADEIAKSPDFLTTPWRDMPERHRSLRSVFVHSWALLTDQEQGILKRLALFQGYITREAAEVVAGASLWDLSTLADKSLLYRVNAGQYTMHELLRHYSLEKLAEAPLEAEKAQRSFSGFFANFLQKMEPALHSRGQKQALQAIAAEIENVRQAWQWMIAQGDVVQVEQSIESLFQFLRFRNRFEEGKILFSQAVARLADYQEGNEQKLKVFQKLRVRQAVFLRNLGHLEEASQLLQESLAVFRQLGDPRSTAFCLIYLANTITAKRDYSQSDCSDVQTWIQEALTLNKTVQSSYLEASGLQSFGTFYLHLHQYIEARNYYRQLLQVCQISGNEIGGSGALNNLGAVADLLNDYLEAKTNYEQALRIKRELGDQRGETITAVNIGFILYRLGDEAGAEPYYQQALVMSQEIGDRWLESITWIRLGLLLAQQGKYQTAYDYSQQAISLAQQIDSRYLQAYALSLSGDALAGLGHFARAASGLEQAYSLLHELGYIEMAMEARAGLVHIFVLQGKAHQAQDWVEEILKALDNWTAVLNFRVHWSCYEALKTNQDPRSSAFLVKTYQQLQVQATKITDVTLCELFLQIPVHREIINTFDLLANGADNQPNIPPTAVEKPENPLTRREIEILNLMVTGLTNQEIAEKLVISLSTVKRHTANIYNKLDASNRVMAIKKAQDLGLLTNPF